MRYKKLNFSINEHKNISFVCEIRKIKSSLLNFHFMSCFPFFCILSSQNRFLSSFRHLLEWKIRVYYIRIANNERNKSMGDSEHNVLFGKRISCRECSSNRENSMNKINTHLSHWRNLRYHTLGWRKSKLIF